MFKIMLKVFGILLLVILLLGLFNLKKVKRLHRAITLFNTKSNYREYYNNKTKSLIEKRYAEDILEFGYEF